MTEIVKRGTNLHNKKIGILTLSASDNCGSLLQAYALQCFLEQQYGADVKIINFESKESRDLYSIVPKPWYKHPKKFVWSLLHYDSIKKQKIEYTKFRYEKLKLTEDIFATEEDFKRSILNLDFIIVGSDQIWNANMYDFSDCFYLPFDLGVNKYSYAASLGSMAQFPKEKAGMIKEALGNFERISVRESEGADTIKAECGIEVPVLSDPTLLLERDFWDSEAGERIIETPFIFFYSWAYADYEMNKIVERFSKEKSLEVYVINPSKWYKYNYKDYGFKIIQKSSPQVFLNLMKYAEYVFVQSFHGVVFANIFAKDFFFLNEQKEKIDFRAGNLLELFNEKDRIVRSYSELLRIQNIKLKREETKVNYLVDKSKRYISEIVNSEENLKNG